MQNEPKEGLESISDQVVLLSDVSKFPKWSSMRTVMGCASGCAAPRPLLCTYAGGARPAPHCTVTFWIVTSRSAVAVKMPSPWHCTRSVTTSPNRASICSISAKVAVPLYNRASTFPLSTVRDW